MTTSLYGSTSHWDSVTLSDDTRISYYVHKGRGTGRIALVHALAMNGTCWDQVVPLLDEAGEVLVYDCRGHGSSSVTAGPYTGGLFANDLKGLLDHLDWGKTIVAGASMGGCVAQAFAVANPARASGLGLLDTTAWYGQDAISNWQARGTKGYTEGMNALIGFQLKRWFSESYAQAHSEVVQSLLDIFTQNDPSAYLATCNMLGTFDAREGLATLEMPCEVFVGELDLATPVAMAENLSQIIPGASLEIVPDCHHYSPIEQPQRVADALNRLMVKAI